MSEIGDVRKIKNFDDYYLTMVKEDKYCPRCGTKNVWSHQEDEDFYVGKDHVCISCDYFFTVQDTESPYSGLKKALTQLKEIEKEE